jgi:hypothetical protein
MIFDLHETLLSLPLSIVPLQSDLGLSAPQFLDIFKQKEVYLERGLDSGSLSLSEFQEGVVEVTKAKKAASLVLVTEGFDKGLVSEEKFSEVILSGNY